MIRWWVEINCNLPWCCPISQPTPLQGLVLHQECTLRYQDGTLWEACTSHPSGWLVLQDPHMGQQHSMEMASPKGNTQHNNVLRASGRLYCSVPELPWALLITPTPIISLKNLKDTVLTVILTDFNILIATSFAEMEWLYVGCSRKEGNQWQGSNNSQIITPPIAGRSPNFSVFCLGIGIWLHSIKAPFSEKIT